MVGAESVWILRVLSAKRSQVAFYFSFYRSPLTLFTPHNTGLFLISASPCSLLSPAADRISEAAAGKMRVDQMSAFASLYKEKDMCSHRDPGGGRANTHAHTISICMASDGSAGMRASERDDASQHLDIGATADDPPDSPESKNVSRASDGVSQNREEYKNDDAAGTLTEYVIKLVSRAAISPQHPFPVCIRPSLCPYFNNRRSHFFRSSWLPARVCLECENIRHPFIFGGLGDSLWCGVNFQTRRKQLGNLFKIVPRHGRQHSSKWWCNLLDSCWTANVILQHRWKKCVYKSCKKVNFGNIFHLLLLQRYGLYMQET